MRTLWMLVALIALSVGLLHAQAKPGKTVALSESFEGDVEAWKLDQELVEGDGVARTGGKCLHGKIEGPNKALFARRTLTLSTQAIYRLEVWIRGTNGTKLAVWLTRGQQRQNIGQFQNTPRRWVRRESAFTPLEDGEWTLEFVAPSSHGAPDGEMWVDDVKVTETRLPATINLTEGEGVSDYPAVAVAPSGEVHAAWVRAGEQGDQLRLARLERDGQGKWSAAQTWDLADPSRAYLMEPVIAAGPGATVLVAPAEWKGGNWELFSVEIGAEGPGRVARLTTTESTEVKPAIAWAGQTLWVAWEGNAGGVRRVYAAQWADGKLGEPIVLSAADVSSYTPAIAADGQGRVWVAYDSFRDSRYDLWVAHFDGTKWQPERRITDDDWIDHRPGLASAKDGLWIAWEQGVCAPRLEAGNEAPTISTL